MDRSWEYGAQAKTLLDQRLTRLDAVLCDALRYFLSDALPVMPRDKILPRRLHDVDFPSLGILALWLGFTCWAAYSCYSLNHRRLYAENGPIENIQASLLAIGCLIYALTAALEKRSDKLILLFCALLCYAFLVRELDVETFNIPQALIFIASGAVRDVTLAVGFLGIFVYAALFFSYYKKAAIGFVKSRTGVLLITGGVFLLIGEFFENLRQPFLEEMVELFGYVLILLSSIAANSFLSGMSVPRKDTSNPSAGPAR